MKLPCLLKDHVFIENNKIGFWKKYQYKVWKTKEFVFEFETPLPNMLNLLEVMANAKTEDEMDMKLGPVLQKWMRDIKQKYK